MGRIIFHIDVNSAFLSWEAAYRIYHQGGRLDLREVPSAVGGDREKRHGIILARSIPAKGYGVQTGEPVVDAKRKCPNLLLVPPNYSLYAKSSGAFIRILRDYSDRIEQSSIDEAFIEMTGCTKNPEETAHEIRNRIRDELGFTVNVGVSSSKLLAKMASDFRKPDRVHTLWKEEIPEKMWPLPVEDLFYVGHATRRKLQAIGVHTIGELAAMKPEYLYGVMKSHGLLIWQYANGIDDSAVVVDPSPNKGYGNSLTTPRDVIEPWLAKQFLLSLAETVSARLRADHVKISVVSVSIRDYNLISSEHRMKLREPTDLTLEIHKAACRLFDELWDGTPIRHLGIHTASVSDSAIRQYGMFDVIDYDKQRKAEAAVDALRKKYGIDCIKRACFLESPSCPETKGMDHMGGGISREKRTVDYSREDVL